ncbi:MAG: gliding motility-associated C-terminal domain-containing protein [Cyclobacteriaceae bacterium]
MLKHHPHIIFWIFMVLGFALKTTESKGAPITRDVLIIYECEKMASIRVRNGVAPYTYVWRYEGNVFQTDSGLGESDLSNLEQALAGNYSLTVTDSEGNTYTEVINFAESTNFILNILYEEEQECEGETFGTVYGTIENGIAPFTVNFYDETEQLVLTELLPGRNIDLNQVPAGKYLVEVIDATGCKELTEIEIEEVEPLVIAPGSGTGTIPETCVANGGVTFNANDYVGAVSFRIRRANGSYATAWLPASSGEVRYNQLEAGDYVLEVIDDLRFEVCPEEVVFNIGNETLLEVIPTADPVTCFGDTDGTITLEVNRLFMAFPTPPDEVVVDIINPGGTTVINDQIISLGPSSGQATFNGFGGGLHTVIVRHGGDDYPECTLTYQVSVGSPAAPLTASVVTTPETCFGEKDGTASVNRSHGWGGYSFLWSDGQTTRNVTNLAPGNYTVTVTDNGGCSITLGVSIDGPASNLDGNIELLEALTCVGANDGSARVLDMEGGWGSYTYLWSNGETGPTAHNLPAGTNTVVVTDLEGCEKEFSVDVPVPDAPEVTFTPTEPTCFEGSDGSLRIQIASGSILFQVTVNGETQTGNDLVFTGLSADQYQVEITYSSICSMIDFVDLGQPSAITIDENNLEIHPILCANDGNGSISGLAISGGTGLLTAQWQQELSGTFENMTGHTLMVLDNLSGGVYRLLVTDENGCQTYKDYTLSEPDPLQSTPPDVDHVTCFGGNNGAVSFTLSGGTAPYTYALNGGPAETTSDTDITISGLEAGLDNFIEIRDANSCAVPNLNFDINSPPEITITDPLIVPETCFDQGNGSIQVDIQGGSGNLAVEWFEPGDLSTVVSTSPNLTNRGPGEYVLRVYDLDVSSCFIQETFTIPPTTELVVSLDGTPLDVFCFGALTGAINIEVEGGTGTPTFEWTGPSGYTFDQKNPSGLAAGLYHVRVTDENGCWVELKDILISEPASGISINVLNAVEPKCHDSMDGRIEVQVGGGNTPYDISWEKEDSPGTFLPVPGNSLTLTNLESGVYKVLVSDDNKCIQEEIVNLEAPDPLEVTLMDKKDVSCFGRNDGQITLEVSGGTGLYFYSWDHGFINQNPTNLGAGTYGVTVTDAFGCSFRLDGIEITQPDELAINLVDITGPSCSQDDGSIEVEFLGASSAVSSNQWIDLSTNIVIAQDQSIVSGLSPGYYRVEYSTESTCMVTRTIHVPGPSDPLSIITNSQDAGCPGETGIIFLSATGGVPAYTYSIRKDGVWEAASSSILAGLEPGIYEVKVADAVGCEDSSTITIDEPNPPVFDVEIENHVSCFGEEDGSIIFSISGGSGGYSVQWYKKTTLGGKTPIAESNLGGLFSATYFMEITYAGGCMITSPDYTLNEPDEVLTDESLIQPVCAEELGSFTLSFTGGSPGKNLQVTSTNGYSMEYDDEVSGTYLFENLQPGDYSWALEDQGCTTQAGSFTIRNILKPQFNHNLQQISCYGANDGAIQITSPLVQSGRTFAVWINGVNQGTMTDFFNLGPGMYQIRLQDSQGCQSDPLPVEITQPDRPLEIANLSNLDVTCFSETTGEATFEIIGGREPYRVSLSGGVGPAEQLSGLLENTSYAFSNLAAGTYHLEVWDKDDVCLTEASFEIEQPEPLTTTMDKGEIYCEGGSTWIELSVSGGIQPYHFLWEKYLSSTDSWEVLPETGSRLNNVTAGQYRYTVQETNGCEIHTETVDMPDGNGIVVDYQAEDILCFGGSSLVSLSASSASSSNFTFFVNGTQIFGSEFMTQAGSYVVYAVDNIHGCSSPDLFFDLTQPMEPFHLEDSGTGDLSCYESQDGTVSLTLGGGTSPYSISLLGNTFSALENEEVIFQDLSANTSYEISVIDANGCTLILPPYQLSQPLPLQASASFEPIACYNGSTDIDLQITGGSSPYSITWSFSENGLDFEELPSETNQSILYDVSAGFYSYRVADGGCADVEEILDIREPSQVVLTATSEDVLCFGGNEGSIAFSPTGGPSSGYRIFFNGVELPDPSVSGLIAGTYTAFALSETCRSENIQIIIDQPATPLSGDLIFQEEVLCHGDLSNINLQVSGGTAPYSAFLDGTSYSVDGSGELLFENIVPGYHEVRVVDAQGCEWSESMEITEPTPIEIFTEELIHITCFGGNDGEIRISVAGGSGSYGYEWLDSDGVLVGDTRNLTGIQAGTYYLSVRDENDCVIREEYEVNEPGPVGFSYSVAEVSCFGGQNGSIAVSGTGGTPGYYLVIDGIQYPDLLATGLTAKTYNVYVLDAKGCASPSQEVTVEQPTPLTLDLEIFPVDCYSANNGSIQVVATGGTSPYHIRWSDGNLSMGRNGLAPGNYELLVTDARGCTIRENVVITQPDPVQVTPTVTDVSCYQGNNGQISLEIQGGNGQFEVHWESVENGEQLGTGSLVDNLSSGLYRAVIRDENGCELIREYEVLQPNSPITVHPLIMDVRCAGENSGSIDLIVTGGSSPYTYQWSTGEISRAVQNKAGGSYQVEVRDAKGCVIIQNIEIMEPASIQVEANIENVSCKWGNDGSISLDISGGTGTFQVMWSNGMNGSSITGLRAGVYTAFVLDDQSCFESYTYHIIEPEEPLSVIGQSNSELCFFDDVISLELTVMGGTTPYSYEWSNEMTTKDLVDIESGTYTVRVTDAMGCLVEETFNVPGPSSPMDVQLTGKFGICSNDERGEISATVSGGQAPYTFLWSNGATTSSLTNLNSGIYRLQVTDAKGCWVEETVEIIRPRDLNVSLEAINGVSCFGANDGMIQIAVHNNDTPFKISWSHGVADQLTISNLAGGVYTATIEDTVGCITTVAYQIREPESLTYYETVEDISCFGEENGAISLEVRGGTAPYYYEWSNGASSRMIRDLSPGSYSVRITDRMGCTTLAEFRVAEPKLLEVKVSYSELLVCNGDDNGFINLDIIGGVQPYRISWSDRPELGTQNRNGLEAGSYTVMVTDDNHCSQVLTLEVEEPDKLEAQLNTRLEVDCENEVLTFEVWVDIQGGTGSNYQIDWSNGEKEVNTTTYLEDGLITVRITDENGCMVELSEVVKKPLAFTEAEFMYAVISTGIQGEILLNDPVQFRDQTLGNVFTWEWDFGDGNKSNEQNPVHTYARPGLYTVSLTTFDVLGCLSHTTLDLEVVASYRILIPNAFSPNGDGLNDTFLPKFRGLEDFELHIFNKWGELVYSSFSLEDQGWDGMLRGKMSPNGNYVYKIVFRSVEGEEGSKTGVFTLVL